MPVLFPWRCPRAFSSKWHSSAPPTAESLTVGWLVRTPFGPVTNKQESTQVVWTRLSLGPQFRGSLSFPVRILPDRAVTVYPVQSVPLGNNDHPDTPAGRARRLAPLSPILFSTTICQAFEVRPKQLCKRSSNPCVPWQANHPASGTLTEPRTAFLCKFPFCRALPCHATHTVSESVVRYDAVLKFLSRAQPSRRVLRNKENERTLGRFVYRPARLGNSLLCTPFDKLGLQHLEAHLPAARGSKPSMTSLAKHLILITLPCTVHSIIIMFIPLPYQQDTRPLLMGILLICYFPPALAFHAAKHHHSLAGNEMLNDNAYHIVACRLMHHGSACISSSSLSSSCPVQYLIPLQPPPRLRAPV